MQADARPMIETEDMRRAKEAELRARNEQAFEESWKRERKLLWFNIKIYVGIFLLTFILLQLRACGN
jgi:hypothetical protein